MHFAMLQCEFPLPSPKSTTTQLLEVQVPSLAGINIPPMKDELRSTSSNNNDWRATTNSQRHLRPTLQRIDTDITASRLPLAVDQQLSTSRRDLSHSQDPTTPDMYFNSRPMHGLRPRGRSDLPVPMSAVDGARRDRDLLPAEHARLRRRGTVSSVAGPYISFASRGVGVGMGAGMVMGGMFGSGSTAGSTSSPSLYAPSPLSPTSSAPSPGFDDAIVLEGTASGDIEGEEDAVIDPEDAWNLIPYHIPWGSAYHGYKGGTLPGPDGKCLFLRSPTPLKNQRTGQACEKCRERKAKCSGTRPSCARCIARGHVCEYGPEIKRVRNGSRADSTCVKEEEEEEEDENMSQNYSPSSSRNLAYSRSSAIDASPGIGRRKTTPDMRMTVAIPPPPMLRRHSAVDNPTSPYNRKKRKVPLRPRRSTMECSEPLNPVGVFPAIGRQRLSSVPNAPSPSATSVSASEEPSEPESLASSSPPLISHSVGLSTFGSETLEHYRFPDRYSLGRAITNASCSLSSMHHNDMELDMELAHQFPPLSVPVHPIPVSISTSDLPTPTSQTHLHAPNPLRYSVSMPQLPYVQVSPANEHPPLHHHSDDNYVYFPNTGDGYSASENVKSTDADYDSASSRVLVNSWSHHQRMSPASCSDANSSEYNQSHGLQQVMTCGSTQNACSDFRSYPSAGGDASALVLLEELNLQRGHISDPFNPVAEWTAA